jgi:hypothetical protein
MTGFLEQNNHVAFYGKWFPIPPRNPQFQSCVPDLLFQSTRLRHWWKGARGSLSLSCDIDIVSDGCFLVLEPSANSVQANI